MSQQVAGFRLSPQQRHLWQLGPECARTLQVRARVGITGALDAAALREAFALVVARHEILRTRFRRAPGIKIPLQFISGEASFEWREVELAGLSESEARGRLESLYEESARRDYDPESAPPLSARLVRLAPEAHALLVSLPAVCSDAASLKNLLAEVASAYATRTRGLAWEPDEATQYADLAEWQNELFDSEDAQAGREFWQTRSADLARGPALPFERAAVADTFEPWRETLTLTPVEAARLKTLAESRGATLSVLLLACWHVLLWRFTGQPVSVVGASFDGRNYEELEQALGLFAKYLPVRCDLDETTRFNEALARVAADVAGVYGWQESFAWETGENKAGETESFLPYCFDSVELGGAYEAGGATFTLEAQHACVERFRLKLSAALRGETAELEFHYDPDAFVQEDVRRLSRQFGHLLELVAANPDAEVARLNFITEEERARYVSALNMTQADYPSGSRVHELFEQQARRTPHVAAVVAGTRTLSYGELNARANHLARVLRGAGVGPDVVVGVYMERAPELLVALLGVLKAGGAYLPLDPQYPAARLSYMLEDARPAAVLTQTPLREKLPRLDAEVIALDADWGEGVEENDLDNVAEGKHLAYVIYTSGSTGRPKGVMVTHAGLVNYLTWCLRAYEPASGRGAPLHSSVSFDLTVTSIFAPLLSGGTVCVVGEGQGADALAEELRAGRSFGFVKLTPAHLELLSRSVRPDEAASCANVFVIGGEALQSDALAFWREHAPETRLINEYGPTETVVGCSVYEVPRGADAKGVVSIGRPIINTQIYLLDARLEPVPVGVAGELYVGGAGLARGYLNRPDTTAERFVPDPFSSELGARLYRTGDLARFASSGDIEFLGRIDQQVKIRGFRIEPGEIEAVLATHPSVAEAVVVAREDRPGDRRLVAYVVAHAGSAADGSDVRRHAAERLPDYMLPAAWVWLERLPLTRNGKVDRGALPAPDTARGQAGAYVGPRNEIERRLAELWAELLHVERVGVEDDFFELGGHSLLAARIVAQAGEMFGVELPMQRLLESPTVEALAAAVAEAQAAALGEGEAALLLSELKQLSEEEARALLGEESQKSGALN